MRKRVIAKIKNAMREFNLIDSEAIIVGEILDKFYQLHVARTRCNIPDIADDLIVNMIKHSVGTIVWVADNVSQD